MIKYILLIAFLSCNVLNGQCLNIGAKFQKTHTLYWENGISVQYSLANFKPDQFFLGFDYVTSRLGTAINSNALKQDNLLASVAWYFRKGKPLHFTTKLNVGFFRASLEEEVFSELPNTALLLSPEVGFSYHLKDLPVAINLGTGYNIGLVEEGQSPGTLQPLFYNLAIYYQLKKANSNETTDF